MKKAKRRMFTKTEKENILKKTGCRCGHCGVKLDNCNATVDHMIPISKGGLNDEYNVIALCEKCNYAKSNYLYDTFRYYPYILDKYRDNYGKYQSFAVNKTYDRLLFGMEVKEYRMYTYEQKCLINQMIRRHAKRSRIEHAIWKLGIRFILSRAYEAEADEIMEMINSSVNDPNVRINRSYYKNEYMVLNDIKYGEFYILRKAGSDKIHGIFSFKRINDQESLNIPQLNTITMNTNLKVRYIMTAAIIDKFAVDCFSDIMNDIMSNMLQSMSIPIYLDILGTSLVNNDECIIMPYQLDGIDVNIEFPTIKYIKKIVHRSAEDIAEGFGYNMDENEMDMFSEILVKWRYIRNIKREANDEEKALLEKYPLLKTKFVPEKCELYNAGLGGIQ